MTDHGVRVFQRWFCSAAAALLLHGGAAGLLMARAPSAVPAPVPSPAPLWVEVGDPSFATAPSDGSREGERHGKDAGAVARRLPTRSATRATTRSSTASSAPASPPAAAMRSAEPVATAALSPLRSTPSHAGPSAVDGLEARANESGTTDGAGAAAAGAPSGGAPTDRGASGASAGRGRGLDAGPRLLGRESPCADLFPYAARSDRGSVEVSIDVAVSGRPVAAQVVDEAPRGQGFALAARHCVRRLRFSPALDVSGKAVASRSVVQLRFERQRETARASL